MVPQNSLVTNFLQNIFLCVRQNKEIGTTWGWVNDDRIFLFGWTIPLMILGNQTSFCKLYKIHLDEIFKNMVKWTTSVIILKKLRKQQNFLERVYIIVYNFSIYKVCVCTFILFIYIYIYICVFFQLCHTRTHIYLYIYTQVYIYIYIYIYILFLFLFFLLIFFFCSFFSALSHKFYINYLGIFRYFNISSR